MRASELLEPSCRVALAAYLHDMGKFAERARIEEAMQKDADGNTRADINKQLYCPQYDGRYTHVHAAYTAIAFDLLERHLPELVGADMAPFQSWSERDADDSLINAAARHHKPDTFLIHFAELIFGNAFLQRQQVLGRNAVRFVDDLTPAILGRGL